MRPDRAARFGIAGTVIAFFSVLAGAQENAVTPGGGRGWLIVPRLSVTETFTNNVGLTSANRQRDQVTDLSAGVRLDVATARLKMHFDYGLHELLYAQDSRRNQSQNSLNSFGTLEAVDRWLFVDFSSSISQQAVSAFAPQGELPNSAINANTSETSTFRVSPYVRGRIPGIFDYLVRYDQVSLRSKSTAAADSQTSDWSLGLTSNRAGTPVGWSVNASQQEAQYGSGRASQSDRLRGVLWYQVNPEWKASINAGTETNDFNGAAKVRQATSGFGVDWTPGPRTQVSLTREKRQFGNSNTLSINHRTPRSVWRYAESKDFSFVPAQTLTASIGSNYDFFYAFFASQPNPLTGAMLTPEETAVVTNRFLTVFAIPANGQVEMTRFLSSRASVQHNRSLSVALIGVRNTFTFFATQSQSDAAGAPTTSIRDDFAATPTISQRGFTASWGYKVSGLTGFNLTGSRQTSTGSAASGLRTTTESLIASLSTELGARTSATLSTRRTVFDSSLAPYRENATTGTLSLRF